MTKQGATELSVQQVEALGLLLSGRSDSQTAADIGVDRSTVWRWRTGDAAFQAELNSRRAELWSSFVDRLRGMLPLALDRVEAALTDELDIGTALALLKGAGLLQAAGAPSGPVDPAEIDRDQRRRAASDELADLMIGMR